VEQHSLAKLSERQLRGKVYSGKRRAEVREEHAKENYSNRVAESNVMCSLSKLPRAVAKTYPENNTSPISRYVEPSERGESASVDSREQTARYFRMRS